MRVWQSFGTYVHVLTGNFSHLFVPEYCTMQCMMRLPTGDDLIEHVVRGHRGKTNERSRQTPSFCSANGPATSKHIYMGLPYIRPVHSTWAHNIISPSQKKKTVN